MTTELQTKLYLSRAVETLFAMCSVQRLGGFKAVSWDTFVANLRLYADGMEAEIAPRQPAAKPRRMKGDKNNAIGHQEEHDERHSCRHPPACEPVDPPATRPDGVCIWTTTASRDRWWAGCTPDSRWDRQHDYCPICDRPTKEAESPAVKPRRMKANAAYPEHSNHSIEHTESTGCPLGIRCEPVDTPALKFEAVVWPVERESSGTLVVKTPSTTLTAAVGWGEDGYTVAAFCETKGQAEYSAQCYRNDGRLGDPYYVTPMLAGSPLGWAVATKKGNA